MTREEAEASVRKIARTYGTAHAFDCANGEWFSSLPPPDVRWKTVIIYRENVEVDRVEIVPPTGASILDDSYIVKMPITAEWRTRIVLRRGAQSARF